MSRIHLIARGIIIQQEHVLLCHKKGMDYVFLPGGHIEPLESAAEAVAREMHEEFGGEAIMERFVTAIENAYREDGKRHHELCIVMAGRLDNVSCPESPVSQEPKLEFPWHPVAQLWSVSLMPPPLVEVVMSCARGEEPSPFISHMLP
jgi:ADP-ribose pyrophosphatase YjhB (NUDIX family)